MTSEIQQIKKTREFILQIVNALSTEELNYIPSGFNNNIIWNVGHIFTGQQRVCYLRSDLPAQIQFEAYSNYIPGSVPTAFVQQDQIARIKELFLPLIDNFQHDYDHQLFLTYKSFVVPYGFEVATIDQAIHFMLFHEGLHLGYIMALKRALPKY